ncbi:hypothetical protein ACFX2J_043088 [Malus domestica]
MGIAKRVLRYIQGILDFGIEYVKGKTTTLIGYYDSDWAISEDDMRNTYSGIVHCRSIIRQCYRSYITGKMAKVCARRLWGGTSGWHTNFV